MLVGGGAAVGGGAVCGGAVVGGVPVVAGADVVEDGGPDGRPVASAVVAPSALEPGESGEPHDPGSELAPPGAVVPGRASASLPHAPRPHTASAPATAHTTGARPARPMRRTGSVTPTHPPHRAVA